MSRFHQAIWEFYGKGIPIVHTNIRGRKSFIEFTDEPGKSRGAGAREKFMGEIERYLERVQREIGPKKRVVYRFEKQKGIGKSQGLNAEERAANEKDASQVGTIQIEANKHTPALSQTPYSSMNPQAISDDF